MGKGLKKFNHVTPALIDLHWLPIQYRIDFKILMLVYKCLNGLAPKYLCDLIKPRRTGRTFRNNCTYITLPKLDFVKCGQRSFSFAGPLLWNRLPEQCKAAKSLDVFKSRVKTYLFKLAYDL